MNAPEASPAQLIGHLVDAADADSLVGMHSTDAREDLVLRLAVVQRARPVARWR
jgi:hypothetical protein